MQLSIKIMFGVKPQEVHTVTLKIKRFTLSSTAYAKQESKMHCLPLKLM